MIPLCLSQETLKRLNSMIKAVVFDLDDTLISEHQYIESGYQKVAEFLNDKYGWSIETTKKRLLELLKKDSKNVFNRLFEEKQVNFDIPEILELVSVYRNHLPNIEFFSDVIPTLQVLKENSIKLGIITDGYRETQNSKLKILQAEKYFDSIIVTEELGREYWKPDPRAFEMMSDALGVQFDEMVYVGDNPKKDFYIRKIYPIHTVRIIREDSVYGDENYKEDIREEEQIFKLDDVVEYIKSFSGGTIGETR